VSVTAGFPDHDIFVIDIADLTKRCHAVEVDEPHFA